MSDTPTTPTDEEVDRYEDRFNYEGDEVVWE